MNASCDEYEVLITGHLDGELDAEQRAKLEAHLETCSVCRREFDAMKTLVVGASCPRTVGRAASGCTQGEHCGNTKI